MYKMMHADSTGLDLLETIKGVMFNVQDLKYLSLSIHIEKKETFATFLMDTIKPHHYILNNLIILLMSWTAVRHNFVTENVPKGHFQRLLAVALRMYLTLYLLLFKQSM